MKLKIKISLAAAVTAVLCAASVNVCAYTPPLDVAVNGSIIKTGGAVYIENGVSYMPVRMIAEALGAEISWDGTNARIMYAGAETIITPGSRYVYDGMKTEPYIYSDRIYMPSRVICGILGAEVEWFDGYSTIMVTKKGVKTDGSRVNTGYTLDDIFWLGRIIEAESAGEPEDGMIAVGNVVLNRLHSEDYPDTIYGVIFDTNGGVQFEPAANGTVYNTPSAKSLAAAKCALSGVNTAGKCLYFLNPDKADSLWITENRVFAMKIGGHEFYL